MTITSKKLIIISAVRNHPALGKYPKPKLRKYKNTTVYFHPIAENKQPVPCVLRGAFLFIMERYSIITKKRKREIVLLIGKGCVYKKCAFCDYYLDKCGSGEECFKINRKVLENVTGEYGELEVINSGSVFELDPKTLSLIRLICEKKHISAIHFESHYLYKYKIPALRKEFSDFSLKMKLGLETFDYAMREKVLRKGIPETEPKIISESFDEANFLFGITGQTAASMEYDIETGLLYFERICVNIMCKNSTKIIPDKNVIDIFMRELYPKYKDNERVDILINNTDFGVGD